MIRPLLRNTKFTIDIVTYCLTGKCVECTGSYVNKILNHRLLCNCDCHTKEKALHNIATQRNIYLPTTLTSRRTTDNDRRTAINE
jgi:hypothetical protein